MLSLTSVLDGVGGQRHAPAALLPGNSSGTYYTGGWVGLGAVTTHARLQNVQEKFSDQFLNLTS